MREHGSFFKVSKIGSLKMAFKKGSLSAKIPEDSPECASQTCYCLKLAMNCHASQPIESRKKLSIHQSAVDLGKFLVKGSEITNNVSFFF